MMNTRAIPELDSLRFFAITLVVLHHQFFKENIVLEWFYHYGWLGVDIFFTLSGFIITKTLISEYKRTNQINLKDFWLKRCFRLWPSWLIILTLSFLATYYVSRHNPEVMLHLKTRWFHYYLHFANYSHAYLGKIHTFTSHFWSLAVEEHFYVIWPLMLSWIYAKKKNPIHGLILLITIPYFLRLLHHFLGMETITITFSTHTRLDGIAWGCLLAYFIQDIKELDWPKEIILSLFALILFFIAGPLKEVNLSFVITELNRPLISLATCLMIIIAMKGKSHGMRAILRNKTLSKLGILSYGVYLIHFITNAVTFSWLSPWFKITNQTALATINLVLPYFPAYLLYTFIDQPFLRLREKYVHHKPH